MARMLFKLGNSSSREGTNCYLELAAIYLLGSISCTIDVIVFCQSMVELFSTLFDQKLKILTFLERGTEDWKAGLKTRTLTAQ